jgi:hypothetical protein
VVRSELHRGEAVWRSGRAQLLVLEDYQCRVRASGFTRRACSSMPPALLHGDDGKPPFALGGRARARTGAHDRATRRSAKSRPVTECPGRPRKTTRTLPPLQRDALAQHGSQRSRTPAAGGSLTSHVVVQAGKSTLRYAARDEERSARETDSDSASGGSWRLGHASIAVRASTRSPKRTS